MIGKVELSGINTAELKVLSNDEMKQLLHQMRAGDEQARQALIEGNLRLVLSVIQRFVGRGENPDDLFQVGCIGLLKAIANFDETKMVRFSTYGVPMIAGEIRRYLRDNSPIRVSRSIRDMAYRVLQCRESLLREQQREPTMEQIAEQLGVPVRDVVSALDAISTPVSLDEPVYSDAWAIGKSASLRSASATERHRWKSPPRLGSRRRRSPVWKKAPSQPSAPPSPSRCTEAAAQKCAFGGGAAFAYLALSPCVCYNIPAAAPCAADLQEVARRCIFQTA